MLHVAHVAGLAQAGDVKGAKALVAPLGPPPTGLSRNAASTWLTYAWLVDDRLARAVKIVLPSGATQVACRRRPGWAPTDSTLA